MPHFRRIDAVPRGYLIFFQQEIDQCRGRAPGCPFRQIAEGLPVESAFGVRFKFKQRDDLVRAQVIVRHHGSGPVLALANLGKYGSRISAAHPDLCLHFGLVGAQERVGCQFQCNCGR